ncbi:TIGR02147 family protein [Bdellovibrio bacteriovorus]|uniref:TIGR02147 family protein n=1 Tax=Bdellovibrio bacteriovorus TaxID=959 RepID=UPI0035A5B596
MSEYLSGHRQPTHKTIETIIKNLSGHEQGIGNELRLCYEKDQLARRGKLDLKNKLSASELSQLKEWYYFAILALFETTDFHSTPSWISERLGVDLEKVQQALQTLLQLGLIKNENGVYTLVTKLVYYIEDDAEFSRQDYHKQLLLEVSCRLEETSLELRDLNTLMIPIRLDRLPEAREKIRSFLKEMAGIMDMSPRSEVYNLSVQLVPLSKSSGRNANR